jgi:hypothetical protein
MGMYEEEYRKLPTTKAIMNMAKRDMNVAIFLGSNPDRLRAIQTAVDKVLTERESMEKEKEEERDL